MSMGEPAYGCATPMGIMRLLQAYDIPLAGKHAVVVGRSPILGRPMAMMLLGANATVTICHSRTQHLETHVRQADIIRSEEHTSELQSRGHLVCRLLLEKKNK